MTESDLAYLCVGFGLSMTLHWITEAAFSFYNLFHDEV